MEEILHQLGSMVYLNVISRQSVVSTKRDEEEDFEAGDLQLSYAIEVSYGEPVKPVSETMSSHRLTFRRPFYEAVLGEVEASSLWREMGMSQQEYEHFLEKAFDQGDAGKISREALVSLVPAMIRLRSFPHLYAGLFQITGSRIRMNQLKFKCSLPLFEGMPREMKVEPFVPLSMLPDKPIQGLVEELVRCGIFTLVDVDSHQKTKYGGVLPRDYYSEVFKA